MSNKTGSKSELNIATICLALKLHPMHPDSSTPKGDIGF